MKIVQFFYGEIPEIYDYFMKRLRRDKPSNIEYELITEVSFDISKFNEIRCVSDLARLLYLREHPYDIWLDSDIVIDNWFEFDRACCLNRSPESVFCPYGKVSVIDRMIEEFVYDRPCLRFLFEKYHSEFETIPEGYFRHLSIGSMLKNNVGLWRQAGNTNVSLVNYENEVSVRFENREFRSRKPDLEIKKDVTLITTCMNRESFLRDSLQTWLSYGFTNIIVVDWSSQIPIKLDNVKIIRVEDKTIFDGSASRNIGAREASSSFLLFIDADVKITSNLNLCSRRNDVFYHGNAATSLHTFGTFLVSKLAFEQVGGFSELLSGWGYEDDDLYRRLREIGLHETTFPFNSLVHTEHDDVLRTQFRNSHENLEESRARNLALSEARLW